MMPSITLGGQLHVSRLAFGGAALGGHDYGPIDESSAINAVHAAVAAGVTLFDVADVYGFGRAETLLGRALHGRRKNVAIATKVGLRWDSGTVQRDSSPRWIEHAVEDSLRRLQTDVIDLYQIHWRDPATPLEATVEVLEKLRKAGKIRLAGCSNFGVADLRQFRAASNQIAYSLLCRSAEDELASWCAANGVSIVAHSVLARGLLTGGRRLGEHFGGPDTRDRSRYFVADDPARQKLLHLLREIAACHGVPMASVAIRWVLDRPFVSCAVVGSKTEAQLAEHLQSFQVELTPDETEMLSFASSQCRGVASGALAR
jgi:aryl-alcohol dehydrogenase-like predicted oxidoreductase